MEADDPGRSPMSERMRELLARAAQEQLAESRQVSAVLTDLRALLAGVDERLRGLARQRPDPSGPGLGRARTT